MTIDFTYDKDYMKTYMPEALKTEVFDLYFGGFTRYKGKDMVLLRRQPSVPDLPRLDQIQILYNGKRSSIEEPLRLHVEGVVIDDYFNTDLWNVIVTIPSVKVDGNPIEAVIPGGDFTENELYGLYELKNGLSDFGELSDCSEGESLMQTFLGSVYIRILNTIHMCRTTAYQTDRGLLESINEKIMLKDDGSYFVKVRPYGIFSGDQQAWLCRCPTGKWKGIRTAFKEKAEGISPNARGSKVNVKIIFDKKYLAVDDGFEYRLFSINKL